MTPWLRRTTLFQRITLFLLVLAAANIAYAQVTGGSPSWSWATLAVLLCLLAFRKRILWRVRNRLLVTYFLFGVVPIFLLGILLMFSVELVLGRFAAERVREGLEARIETVRAAVQDLAAAASEGSKPELLNEIRRRVPGLAAVVRVNGKAVLAEGDAALQGTALQAGPEFQGLLESAGRYFIVAKVRTGQGNAEAIASLPLSEETLASLTDGVVTVAGVFSGDDDINMRFGPSDSQITVESHDGRKEVAPKGLGPPRGSWDKIIGGLLSEQVQTSSGEAAQVVFTLFARPSHLAAGVLTGRMATIILGVLVIVTGVFLLVEIASLIFSLSLTRTITRSVHDLHQGTVQVAGGDFSKQIPVRGEHQLSELATSFNSMISRIGHLMGEVRKKEKIEAELEIARQVQARLFPRSVPEVKTLELAGTCIPGRFVSGDYYDFFRLDDRHTAIALGDVSGKGVSAALLMASIQSALHAQLKFSGERASPSLSMAVLMGLISQQLYENTPAEKYATFFCSVYDDETRVLRYTNAGHLKPILIRQGKASTLPGDGMVAGLLPNVKYEQQEFQMEKGDLLAIFSDGIPEAEDAAAQEFGEPRLADLLAKHAQRPLSEIIDLVTTEVRTWIHDPDGRDDTTIVLARGL